jgi:uncharacterized membrane protein HdeD (DUF308 family)
MRSDGRLARLDRAEWSWTDLFRRKYHDQNFHENRQAFNAFAAVQFFAAKNWWLFTLRGLFAILFGLTALIFPSPTILSLVLLFSAYMLVNGIVGIISAARAMRRRDQWGLLVFEGILNILVGLGAFLWPGLTVLAFVLLVAVWALVTGGLVAAAGFRSNLEHARIWLSLGGLLSVSFGVLLIITPLIGAAVLTWWMGAYALAFGIALVIFSFKLRARQDERARPHTILKLT